MANALPELHDLEAALDHPDVQEMRPEIRQAYAALLRASDGGRKELRVREALARLKSLVPDPQQALAHLWSHGFVIVEGATVHVLTAQHRDASELWGEICDVGELFVSVSDDGQKDGPTILPADNWED